MIMIFNEDVMHDIYCASLLRMYDGRFNITLRDAVINEATERGFEEEALVLIADEIELHDQVEQYSDAYKDVHGFRPRQELEWFRGLSVNQRTEELKLLHNMIMCGDRVF